MKQTSATSLKSHCTACQSKCCKHNRFIADEADHEKIISSGAPDYFTRIVLPVGTFYMNDYRGGTCGYLRKNGACSLEKVKPDVCKIYPAQAVYEDGFVEKNKNCPIPYPLPKIFTDAVAELVKKRDAELKPIYWNIVDAYDARYLPGRLSDMNVQIFPPPKPQ